MHTPSEQLLKEVRAELVRRGTSLKAFCEQHGYVRQAVGMALSGKRPGPKSRNLAERFIEALDAKKLCIYDRTQQRLPPSLRFWRE